MKTYSSGGNKRIAPIKGGAKLKRGERERLAHRQEIAEAAERVFSARGFERATMEEIAHEAEFSVGALYTFFENKETLWIEVISKIGRDLLAAARKEIEAASGPLEAITAIIEMRLHHLQKHGTFIRVFVEATAGNQSWGNAPFLKRRPGFYDEYIDDAAALFEKAMKQGLLRKADATYTVLLLEGMIHSFRTYWIRRNMVLPVSEQTRLIQQHFFTLVSFPKKGKDGG